MTAVRRNFAASWSWSCRLRVKFSAVPSNGAGPSSRGTCLRCHLPGLGCCCGYRNDRFRLRRTRNGDHFRRHFRFRRRHCCCVCCHRKRSCRHRRDIGRKSFRRGHDGNCCRLRRYNLGGHLPAKNGPYGGASGPVSDDRGCPCTSRSACSVLLLHFRVAYPGASTGCYRTGTTGYRTNCCFLHHCTGSGSCPYRYSCCFLRGSRLHGTNFRHGNFPGCGSTRRGLLHHGSSGWNGNSGKPSRKHDSTFKNIHTL